jgi:hypothetical protein
MNFSISWVLGLFKKPEVEVTFDKAEVALKEPTFPVEKPKRKPAAKKTVAKKATSVAKKKTATKKR